jgi:sec-independent protein translocase protein TatA
MDLNIILGIIGPNQIIIILVIVVLLFGAKKIPELMKGVGKGIKEFKDATGKEEENKKDETK